jgi:hypothetical protein
MRRDEYVTQDLSENIEYELRKSTVFNLDEGVLVHKCRAWFSVFLHSFILNTVQFSLRIWIHCFLNRITATPFSGLEVPILISCPAMRMEPSHEN